MGQPGRERDAFERAVEALGRKERTGAELAAWLGEQGFTQAETDGAIARLAELGELDDERFARRYAEDKRELAGWGSERIREALLARGLGRDLVETALSEDAYETELARAVGLLARRAESLGDEPSRARALAFLARRGYELELAYEAVRRFECQGAATPGC
jgi:regulatory protein